MTLSRFVGNGFRRFGCSQGGPTTCQSWAKTHGKNHPKTPKPLPTKRESVTNISEEPHVGALLTCLLERTLPFETKAIYAIVKFFFFLFLKNVVKPLRSRTRASVSKIMSATNRQANRCHRKLRFGVTPVMVLATRANPAKGHVSRRRSGVTFVGVFLIHRSILG